MSQPLLSAAEEESLFCWMNYHRYRAEQLRRRALRAKSPRKFVLEIQRRLQLANKLRNRIVASNLRLVVSVAKKLARSLDQMSELISEGVLPLIRAVELFDISLGNRFSTYATWAVRNQMLRSIKRSQVRSAIDVELSTLPVTEADAEATTKGASRTARVQSLLETLPEREQRVLRARFGLAGEPSGQSLADVARKVGLSKERVRQIVLHALEELRSRFASGER